MVTRATLITIARIILTPFIVKAILHQVWPVAFLLLVIAALTDIFDGFLARRWHEETMLGACLDPIADKILILSLLCALAFVQSPFAIPLWFVVLIAAKELVLIAGVCILYMFSGSVPIKPSCLGKSTTAFHLIFMLWLFVCYVFAWMPFKTLYIMIGSLLMISGVTLMQYIKQGLS